MQFIFDHMGSFFAMSGVLLIFGLIQLRGTQNASEAVINNVVYSEIVNFGDYLQIDLNNMRTETQTDDAIAAGNYKGGTAYECSITKTGDVTTVLSFPTLADPASDYSASDPTQANVELVSYTLTDTGETITIRKGDTDETVTLYTIDRMVDGKITASSSKFVTHFLVEFLNKGATSFTSSSASCTADLRKIRFELKFATEGIEYITKDQKSTSQTNVSRFGATVPLPNMEQ